MPSDIDLLPDINYLQNVTYGPSTNEDATVIDLPTLMVPSYHVCYAHAILDYTFLYFWLLSEIRLKYPEFTKFIILFEKEEVFSDHNVASVIDSENKCFNIPTWNTLVSLLIDSPPLFEHLLERPHRFKHLFFYKKNQMKYQRCPWNSIVNYSHHRPIPHDEVVFSDTLIYRKLNEFRLNVFSFLNLPLPSDSKSLIIIERGSDRRFDSVLFQSLVKEVTTNLSYDFKGTFCLDRMSFKEQVELFSKTSAFIMRHGSSEINLLWVPQNSIVFEIGGGPDGISQPNMYKRICKLTDTRHIYLDYNALLEKAKQDTPLDFAHFF